MVTADPTASPGPSVFSCKMRTGLRAAWFIQTFLSGGSAVPAHWRKQRSWCLGTERVCTGRQLAGWVRAGSGARPPGVPSITGYGLCDLGWVTSLSPFLHL